MKSSFMQSFSAGNKPSPLTNAVGRQWILIVTKEENLTKRKAAYSFLFSQRHTVIGKIFSKA
jgi:hypothetical protein